MLQIFCVLFWWFVKCIYAPFSNTDQLAVNALMKTWDSTFPHNTRERARDFKTRETLMWSCLRADDASVPSDVAGATKYSLRSQVPGNYVEKLVENRKLRQRVRLLNPEFQHSSPPHIYRRRDIKTTSISLAIKWMNGLAPAADNYHMRVMANSLHRAKHVLCARVRLHCDWPHTHLNHTIAYTRRVHNC